MFFSNDIRDQLARMERMLRYLMRASQLEKDRDHMAQADIDKLRAQVARNTEVGSSAVTLIQGLAQQIRDAADDPAELAALAAELESNATKLGEAVAANT